MLFGGAAQSHSTDLIDDDDDDNFPPRQEGDFFFKSQREAENPRLTIVHRTVKGKSEPFLSV